MEWIKTEHLDFWASTLSARTELPGLVADLIRASAGKISEIRFPSGSKGQVRGFDGWLEAVGAPPYVPAGESIWEFGVSGATAAKLGADYDKRTAGVAAADRVNRTLVLVTPFTWDSPGVRITDWVAEKKASADWKDVKVIDGAQLIDWLNQRPSAAARWARRIGVQPTAVRSTDQYWEEYVRRFATPISEGVILCGREKQAEKLLAGLMQPNGPVPFLADSPEEVVAFAVAVIRTAEQPFREYLESRTLVVDSKAAGDALYAMNKVGSGVFLPRGQGMASIALLADKGPTLRAGSYDRPDRNAETLERPPFHLLAKAFEEMGLDRDEAMKVVRDCGRSITVLARTYPGAGHPEAPAWLATADTLIAPVLAVGWDADHDKDRAILEALGCRPYDEIERALRPFLRSEDPPLEHQGSVWHLRAPVDAFVHLAHRLTTTDLKRFRAAAIQILSEVEPDPSPDDFRRTFEERQTRYSEWLRNGVATTILLIASLSKQAGLGLNGVTPQDWVDGLVGALPLDEDHRLLASLRNQMTYLMEAAPRPLLAALGRLLEGHKIAPIFHEIEGPITTRSRHAGLLWGLEMLAWDPNCLVEVCVILARLAMVDPGGRLLNRPINSLREILLPWSPNTYAGDDLRLAALDAIERCSTDIGWKVSLALLPRSGQVSTPTPKPRFREAGQDKAVVPTDDSLAVFYTALARRVLKLAEGHASRTAELVKVLEQFGGAPWDEAVSQIRVSMAEASPDERRPIWDALVQLRDRHRRFASANWALKADYLSQIEALVEAFVPHDANDDFGDLFDDWFPAIAGEVDPDEAAILAARRKAVHQILNEANPVESLINLASRSKLPSSVGQAAAYEIDDLDMLSSSIELALRAPSEERLEFAAAISSIAYQRFPDTWPPRLKLLVTEAALATVEMVRLILPWPETDAMWDFVESLGPEADSEYWRTKRAFRVEPGRADLDRAIRKYIAAGRPGDALDVAGNRLAELDKSMILALLDTHIANIVNADGVGVSVAMVQHKLERIFKFLDGSEKVSLEELARRELQIFPLLEHGRRPLSLHALMATSGSFFGQIVGLVHPPASIADLPEAEKENRKRMAETGFRLLFEFKRSPGVAGDPPTMDREEIQHWIADVRAANTDPDRRAIYDIYIGQALAHAPAGLDGSWPPEALRDVIETLAAPDIERGIATERFNMRGVVWKSVYEGGTQERALAADYRVWRDRALAWPRTSRLLEAIAAGWDGRAEAEDIRARQDMMKE